MSDFKLDKKAARKNFDGSRQLFASCWKKYLKYLDGAIDDPKCQEDVDGWLDSIASEKVNNPESPFYIYG